MSREAPAAATAIDAVEEDASGFPIGARKTAQLLARRHTLSSEADLASLLHAIIQFLSLACTPRN